MKPLKSEYDHSKQYLFRGEDIESLNREELIIALQICIDKYKELNENPFIITAKGNPFIVKRNSFFKRLFG